MVGIQKKAFYQLIFYVILFSRGRLVVLYRIHHFGSQHLGAFDILMQVVGETPVILNFGCLDFELLLL